MKTKPPECWASDPQARGLRIEVSADRSLLLPFDQFAFAELKADGKYQELLLVFATHEVTLRGHSLRRIETAVQRLEISQLSCVPRNYRSLITEGEPVVLEIVVVDASGKDNRPV